MTHRTHLQTYVSDRLSPNEFEVLLTFEFGAFYLLPDFLKVFETAHPQEALNILNQYTKVNLSLRAVPSILLNLYRRDFIIAVKINNRSYLKLSQKGNMAVYGEFQI